MNKGKCRCECLVDKKWNKNFAWNLIILNMSIEKETLLIEREIIHSETVSTKSIIRLYQ